MGSAAKARAARTAETRRHEHSLMPTHVEPASPSGWVVLQKSIRGVVTAFMASARPLTLAGVVVGLVWLALKIVDRFQLWMTAAGVLMIVMSIASAYQEVAKPSTVTVEYLDEDVEGCTKMITIPTAQEIAVTVATPLPTAATATVPKATTSTKIKHETKPVTRNVNVNVNTNVNVNVPATLTVVHCGTVIDIHGSRGVIIPHKLNVATSPKPVTPSRGFNRGVAQLPDIKLPFVIAFDLSAVLAVLRHEIVVGATVQFLFPGDGHSPDTVLAVNVKPVASETEIAKSRDALQTCKLAREQSFARAMGKLKTITPRNQPIKHHVDLIKYAEHLDDTDLPPLDEEFI